MSRPIDGARVVSLLQQDPSELVQRAVQNAILRAMLEDEQEQMRLLQQKIGPQPVAEMTEDDYA